MFAAACFSFSVTISRTLLRFVEADAARRVPASELVEAAVAVCVPASARGVFFRVELVDGLDPGVLADLPALVVPLALVLAALSSARQLSTLPVERRAMAVALVEIFFLRVLPLDSDCRGFRGFSMLRLDSVWSGLELLDRSRGETGRDECRDWALRGRGEAGRARSCRALSLNERATPLPIIPYPPSSPSESGSNV